MAAARWQPKKMVAGVVRPVMPGGLGKGGGTGKYRNVDGDVPVCILADGSSACRVTVAANGEKPNLKEAQESPKTFKEIHVKSDGKM